MFLKQRGVFLIEALVAILILAFVALGSVAIILYEEGNTAKIKNQISAQNYGLVAMSHLVYEDICTQTLTGKDYPLDGLKVDVPELLSFDLDPSDSVLPRTILKSGEKYGHGSSEIKVEEMFIKNISGDLDGSQNTICESLPLNVQEKRTAEKIVHPLKLKKEQIVVLKVSTKMKSLSLGTNHTCAVLGDGGLWCWGEGSEGRLGNGDTSEQVYPVSVKKEDDNDLKNVTEVSAGDSHTCAALGNGEARCWGDGAQGLLGDGNIGFDKSHPVAVKSVDGSGYLKDVVSISAGRYHTCVILGDGEARCWGNGSDGRLGNGGSLLQSRPVRVEESPGVPLKNVVSISAGGKHTCAILLGGEAMCWGDGFYDQLGDGGNSDQTLPVRVEESPGVPLENVVFISSGENHTCAILVGGEAMCWGLGSSGQLGNESFNNEKHPVAVRSEYGPGNLKNVTSISAGYEHTCAVLRNGQARCWGKGHKGQLGNNTYGDELRPEPVKNKLGTDNLQNVISIVAGEYHTCAILVSGQAVCWGEGDKGRLGNGDTSPKNLPVVVREKGGAEPGLNLTENVRDISIGDFHTCAVLVNGQVRCWGQGANGQLGNGSTSIINSLPVAVRDEMGRGNLKNVLKIFSGHYHTCAILVNRKAMCWGLGTNGQLGNADNSDQTYPVFVRSESGPGKLNNVISISASRSYTCAVLGNGEARCWGNGSNGRLGRGTSSKNRPVAVKAESGSGNLQNVASIFAGHHHTCAVLVNGEARCWGLGRNSQLGNGAKPNIQIRPVIVKKNASDHLKNVASISAGQNNTCAILRNGEAMCWGLGGWGQLGNGDTLEQEYPVSVKSLDGSDNLKNIVSLAQGWFHTCAVLVNGEARCWGRRNQGQLGDGIISNESSLLPVVVKKDGNPLQNVVSLFAGHYHTCAVVRDADAYCWGNGTRGQLGNGDTSTEKSLVEVNLSEEIINLKFSTNSFGVGASHACMILNNDQVSCWGQGASGQLGDGGSGANYQKLRPVIVEVSLGVALENVVSLAVGDHHTCAVLENKEAWCWGQGASGQLGDGGSGANYQKLRPVAVKAESGLGHLTNITSISAGYAHTCVALENGEVRCWGDGSSGQLGNGTPSNQNRPVAVRSESGSGNLENVVSLSAGYSHTCARLGSGEIRCWGSGSSGQLGNGSSTDQSRPVAVKAESGPANLQNVFFISAGKEHTCAVLENKEARCWGKGDKGQLGDAGVLTQTRPVAVQEYENSIGSDLENLKKVIGISADRSHHTCVRLEINGGKEEIKCWGENNVFQLGKRNVNSLNIPFDSVVGEDESPFKNRKDGNGKLYLGEGLSCVSYDPDPQLDPDPPDSRPNNLYCWGKVKDDSYNDNIPYVRKLDIDHQYHTATLVSTINITPQYIRPQISIGEKHTCALLDHKPWCWGKDDEVLLGRSSSGDGNKPQSADEVDTLDNFFEIVSGSEHTCTLFKEGSDHGGKVKCWGKGSSGRLGNNASSDSSEPQFVVATGGSGELTDVVSIVAGENHTCGLLDTGEMVCWGKNNDGQLGDGTNVDKMSPAYVKVSDSENLENIIQIAAGHNRTCVVLNDLTAKCWGLGLTALFADNTSMIKGANSRTLSSVLDVFPSSDHTCTRILHVSSDNRERKKVLCWGSSVPGVNSSFVADNPQFTQVSDPDEEIDQIFLGTSHICALKQKEVSCWGRNNHYQAGEISDLSSPKVVSELSSGVHQIASGFNHNCAIKGEKILCWGKNSDGQLGDLSTDNNHIPVTAFFTCSFRGILFTIIMKKKESIFSLGQTSEVEFSRPLNIAIRINPDGKEVIDKCIGFRDKHVMGKECTGSNSFAMGFDELGQPICKKIWSNGP